MFKKNRLAVGSVAGAALAAAALLPGSPAEATAPSGISAPLAQQLGSIAKPANSNEAAGQHALEKYFAPRIVGTPILQGAVWNQARSYPVDGSSKRAWIVPAGDEVCIVAPDAIDGYGVGCSGVDEIAAEKAVLVMVAPVGADYPSIAVGLVPDTSNAPTITNATGKQSKPDVEANVIATTLPKGGKIRTSGVSYDTVPPKLDGLQTVK